MLKQFSIVSFSTISTVLTLTNLALAVPGILQFKDTSSRINIPSVHTTQAPAQQYGGAGDVSINLSNHLIKQLKVQIPRDSSLTCQRGIERVKLELKRKGFFVPYRVPNGVTKQSEVRIDKNLIRRSYYGYPAKRTETVIFVLGQVGNLQKQPKFIATLASQIMAECNQVGLVEFAYWYEGRLPVGYFADNTARVFTNIITDEQIERFSRLINSPKGNTRQFEWGYFSSP